MRQDIEVTFREGQESKFSGGRVIGAEECFDDSDIEVGRDLQGDGDTFEGSGVVMDSCFTVGQAEHGIVFGALQEGA